MGRLFFHGRHGQRPTTGPIAFAEDVPSHEERPDEVAARGEVVERVRAAVEELPPGRRRAVALVGLAERTYEEAAAVAGVHRGSIAASVYEAKVTLRKRLAWAVAA